MTLDQLCETLSLDDILGALEADNYSGFCLSCGTEHSNIEPDARKYTCENCGLNRVYGAEEILIMGVLS